MGQEESKPIDESTPPQTLEKRDVASVAKYINEGKAKRIVVMVRKFEFLILAVSRNDMGNVPNFEEFRPVRVLALPQEYPTFDHQILVSMRTWLD